MRDLISTFDASSFYNAGTATWRVAISHEHFFKKTKIRITMKNIFTILLVALFAFAANAAVCTITLTGDWSASSLHIKEKGGVDTIITGTAAVWFRGTTNATFTYSGINATNTFEYLSCAGYDFTSPVLTNGDVYISAGGFTS
jgi:hypothetical protein